MLGRPIFAKMDDSRRNSEGGGGVGVISDLKNVITNFVLT